MQDDNHDEEGTYVWDAELQDYKYVPPNRGAFGEHLYEGRRRLKELLAQSRAADPEFSVAEVRCQERCGAIEGMERIAEEGRGLALWRGEGG